MTAIVNSGPRTSRSCVPQGDVMRNESGLSVVLPVYAGVDSGHLRAALTSIVHQTAPPAELLVVEDGPLLPCQIAVLEECAAMFPALRRVALKMHQGVAVALQTGLKAASGTWVARMDADDIALPTRLEAQEQAMASGRYDVVGAAMLEFRDDPEKVVGVRRMPEEHQAIAAYLRRGNPINHPTVVFNRQLALDVGGYRRLDQLEDYDLWARMLVAGARFHNLPEPLVLFRAGNAMLARRKQRGVFRNEVVLQRGLRAYGTIGYTRSWVNLVMRTTFRLLPAPLMAVAYRRIFLDRARQR